jgi:hypothetical protein
MKNIVIWLAIDLDLEGGLVSIPCFLSVFIASIAQLGERKTEDLKVTGSIPVRGTSFFAFYSKFSSSFFFSNVGRCSREFLGCSLFV